MILPPYLTHFSFATIGSIPEYLKSRVTRLCAQKVMGNDGDGDGGDDGGTGDGGGDNGSDGDGDGDE